jgi:hypothetical protein
MCYIASTNTVGGLNNNENCKNEIRIASLLPFEITKQNIPYKSYSVDICNIWRKYTLGKTVIFIFHFNEKWF